jgi:hypothetical protein
MLVSTLAPMRPASLKVSTLPAEAIHSGGLACSGRGSARTSMV